MKILKILTDKFIPLFKGIRIYAVLNILYSIFLLSLNFAQSRYYDNVYDIILFYFDSPYSDLKLWFPRFYLIVYSFIVAIKVLIIALCVYAAYLLYQLFARRAVLFLYNKRSGYLSFIIYESIVAGISLVFYLFFYYISKLLLPQILHEGMQVYIARGFLLQIIVQSFIVISVNFDRILNHLKMFLLAPSLPHNIAVLRILFFLYLTFIYVTKYLSALPTVSLSTKVPLPYMGWLIELIPINTTLYIFFIGAGIICCLFIIAGFKTRWFLALNAVCVFYIMATPNFFGKLWHEQIVIWVSWFFMFSRCYDVFSVDALVNKQKLVKSADYTFPVRFVWLQLGIIYFWAGFYKLWDCGFDWALSQSMINQVQLEWLQHYDKIPAIRIDNYPLLLKAGGLLVIGFELCYILFLLKPANRWIAAAGGLLLHNIIGYFMYINFLAWLQVFYLFYIDFTRLFSKAKLNITTVSSYSRWAFRAGTVILSMNFLCGIFNVHSYPFSAYPSYSALIPDKIKIIHFSPCLPGGTSVDVHLAGKTNNFIWENYGGLEYDLINDFERGENVQKRVQDYWEIWQNHNTELKKYKNVKVFVSERDVSPAGINQNKIKQYMGMIGDCN